MMVKKRSIPKAVRERVTQEKLDYWNSLSAQRQEAYYSNMLSDHRSSSFQENIQGKFGMGRSEGKGGVLVDAICQAFADSLVMRQRHEERLKEYQVRPLTCKRCTFDSPANEGVSVADTFYCFDCLTEQERGFLGI